MELPHTKTQNISSTLKSSFIFLLVTAYFVGEHVSDFSHQRSVLPVPEIPLHNMNTKK